jgi:hypothetical protein
MSTKASLSTSDHHRQPHESSLPNLSLDHQNHPQVSCKHWLDLVTLTWLGAICIALTFYLDYSYGQKQGDYLIQTSMLCLKMFFAILVLASCIEAYQVKRWLSKLDSLESDGSEVEVGQWLASGFNLNRPWSNPLFQLIVEWKSPQIQQYELQGQSKNLLEFVIFARRGDYSSIERYIHIEDLFGFTRMTLHVNQSCRLKVLPQSSQSIPTDIQQMQVGEDFYDPQGMPQGDLVELRRYQDGDPNKLIIWRLYARSRQLMVRRPERALSLKQDLLAYFLADPSDEASAVTARSYLENGFLGQDFLFFADGCQHAATDAHTAMNHLLKSAHAHPQSAFPLLKNLDYQRQKSCLIFASALTPLADLQSIQQSLPSPPTFILSYPNQKTFTKSKKYRSKLLKVHPTHNYVDHNMYYDQLNAITSLQDSLVQKGSHVMIIIQPSGRILSALDIE